jgi:hypothetical protein
LWNQQRCSFVCDHDQQVQFLLFQPYFQVNPVGPQVDLVHTPEVAGGERAGRQRFSSAILPAWARRSPQITEVLPLPGIAGVDGVARLDDGRSVYANALPAQGMMAVAANRWR